jgi:tetratricopeptide (TPR) repeat protein
MKTGNNWAGLFALGSPIDFFRGHVFSMSHYKLLGLVLCGFATVALATTAYAQNEGQEDLDKATQLKVTAETLDDLNEVIDRLDTAIEKGLDEENAQFAENLLVSSLVQRGTLFAAAVLNVPVDDPQRGLRAMQFRQFALSDLQRAVGIDDALWEAHLLIAKLQVLPYGDSTAARRALTKVIGAADAAPEQKAEAYALRSAVQNDEQKRLEDLTQAVELQPRKPDYLRLRANYLYSKENFDEALADADRALELEADHAATNELRGMILLSLEKYDEALASFNRATELVPEAVLPYQHRGELYRQKGDLEKALEQLTKALELAPKNVATLLVRAGIYYELEKTEEALADIDQAIRIEPQIVHPYLMKAEIYASTDRLDEAIEQLERLSQKSPGNVQLLSRMGSFYLIDGRPRKAIEVLTQVVEQEPDNFTALRYRADAHLNIGQHKEAIADFERALELNEADEGVLNNFAWVLATSPDEELRDGERAIELATKAAELSGHATPHVLSTLAAAYAETGDFESAKKWSQKAVELSRKALESAESSDERETKQADVEQLQKELANYQEGKPVRERQTAGEADDEPPSTDQTLAPSVEPAPARTADF